jgi:hypothetical protein
MPALGKRVLGLTAVLVAFAVPAVAASLSDVVHLADGTVLYGWIVEEVPGQSYTVETTAGERIDCPADQVKLIEKRLEPRESAIQQQSIVFLTDGVVFRGVVVEREIGGPVVLELADGRLLHVTSAEIARIATEPVAGGIARKRPLAGGATRKSMVEFEIALVQKQVAEAQRKREAAAKDTDGDADLEAAEASLREELEALEAERRRAADEAARDEEASRKFEEEFGDLAAGLRDSSQDLRKRVESCQVPELREQLEKTLGTIDEKVAEITQRAEAIVRSTEPDPRLAPIEAAEAGTRLAGLLENRLWKDPSFQPQMAAAAAGVPVEERQRIYRENRRTDSLGPALVNLIPFLAAGSWLQGDTLGAGLSTGAMTLGVGTALVANAVLYSRGGDPSTRVWFIVGGLAATALGYVSSLISPFVYVSGQNAALAEALGLGAGGGAP